jgi:hypothetical protein
MKAKGDILFDTVLKGILSDEGLDISKELRKLLERMLDSDVLVRNHLNLIT